MSKETSSFVFSFPEVSRQYKTNIHREISSSVLIAILEGSLPWTIGVGVGAYLVHTIYESINSVFIEKGVCYGLLGSLGYPIIIGVSGYLISKIVGKSAIKAKFPDAKKVGKMALGIGVIGYLTFFAMYMLFFDPSERFDHWIDYVRQAVYLLLFAGIPWLESGVNVQNTPFCENCNDFMVSDDIGKYDTSGYGKGIEIAKESELLDILNSRNYVKLNSIKQNWATGNYCVVRIWHCSVCKQNGFIDCVTVQSKRVASKDGHKDLKSAHRLIHSSSINGEEIKNLLKEKRKMEMSLK